MALQVNLQKSVEALTLNLSKEGITTPPIADVIIACDVSGSFDEEHSSGRTNDLLTRLIPFSMVFDPDKKMEVYPFASGVCRVPDITLDNYQDFVKKHIMKCSEYNGGTHYSPVIRSILTNSNFIKGYSSSTIPAVVKTTFMQRLTASLLSMFQFFSKKKTQVSNLSARAIAGDIATTPKLVFFITDGDSMDEVSTDQLFTESEKRGDNIYFQFIAFGSSGFNYLKGLQAKHTNVGFTSITNMSKWVEQSDEDLNKVLVSPKFISWLKG
jgi:hypothetical protein